MLVATCVLMPSVHAAAQQQPVPPSLDTIGTRQGAIGVHALLGAFVGRFDLDGGGAVEHGGLQAGLGLGELVQLTGWYWRGWERDEGDFTADAAWGGELQFNLNAGFGITPFVTAGIGRLSFEGRTDETAAIAGAGLQFPLGPLLLHAGARDYMLGVSGLRGDDSPEDVTHNWQFSAGLLVGIGRSRPQRAVVAERSTAALELAALRDSLARAPRAPQALPPVPGDTTPTAGARVATDPTQLNYQSAERISIPIPTWGSITLRYGPEPEQPAPPIIIQTPAPGVAPQADASASQQVPVPGQPGAQQPLVIMPPQQAAPQMVAGQQGVSQAQLDGIASRVLDGLRLSLLPQLEASQTQRMNALRQDMREELMRIEGAVAALAPGVAAAPPAPGVPATPAAIAGAAPPPAVAAPQRQPGLVVPSADPSADPAAVRAQMELAAAAAELETARRERALRDALAEAAAAQPTLLRAMEAARGPALVMGDAAFTADGLSISEGGRVALDAVATLLRANPARVVYVQAHVDATRPELESQRLSELRAEAVRSALVRAGVQPDRILAVGYGHGRPAATNATATGRTENRRVEIVMGRE
ncbi:MAG TPA: OmpA family protein [Longimicrobiales bacterium]|nr:OmpA family protein [Longimicrobiales bacterium]